MLICNHCGLEYRRNTGLKEFNMCPSYSCKGRLIEIDDILVDIVKKFIYSDINILQAKSSIEKEYNNDKGIYINTCVLVLDLKTLKEQNGLNNLEYLKLLESIVSFDKVWPKGFKVILDRENMNIVLYSFGRYITVKGALEKTIIDIDLLSSMGAFDLYKCIMDKITEIQENDSFVSSENEIEIPLKYLNKKESKIKDSCCIEYFSPLSKYASLKNDDSDKLDFEDDLLGVPNISDLDSDLDKEDINDIPVNDFDLLDSSDNIFTSSDGDFDSLKDIFEDEEKLTEEMDNIYMDESNTDNLSVYPFDTENSFGEGRENSSFFDEIPKDLNDEISKEDKEVFLTELESMNKDKSDVSLEGSENHEENVKPLIKKNKKN